VVVVGGGTVVVVVVTVVVVASVVVTVVVTAAVVVVVPSVTVVGPDVVGGDVDWSMLRTPSSPQAAITRAGETSSARTRRMEDPGSTVSDPIGEVGGPVL
jgi:hypothetical protein